MAKIIPGRCVVIGPIRGLDFAFSIYLAISPFHRLAFYLYGEGGKFRFLIGQKSSQCVIMDPIGGPKGSLTNFRPLFSYGLHSIYGEALGRGKFQIFDMVKVIPGHYIRPN